MKEKKATMVRKLLTMRVFKDMDDQMWIDTLEAAHAKAARR